MKYLEYIQFLIAAAAIVRVGMFCYISARTRREEYLQQSSKTVSEMLPVGNIEIKLPVVQNERQTRELAKVFSNCRNCGAPRKVKKCEYCWTVTKNRSAKLREREIFWF